MLACIPTGGRGQLSSGLVHRSTPSGKVISVLDLNIRKYDCGGTEKSQCHWVTFTPKMTTPILKRIDSFESVFMVSNHGV
jgi:hypothetical protein